VDGAGPSQLAAANQSTLEGARLDAAVAVEIAAEIEALNRAAKRDLGLDWWDQKKKFVELFDLFVGDDIHVWELNPPKAEACFTSQRSRPPVSSRNLNVGAEP
jgi:hypothetical protein